MPPLLPAPQRVWLDDGPPRPRLVFSRRLPPEECTTLRQTLGPAVDDGLTFRSEAPG